MPWPRAALPFKVEAGHTEPRGGGTLSLLRPFAISRGVKAGQILLEDALNDGGFGFNDLEPTRVAFTPNSTRSAYSTDDTTFPYKLVRFRMGDEDDDEADWEMGCFLFADDLVVHASVEGDVSN